MVAVLLVGLTKDGAEVRATLWAETRAAALMRVPVFIAVNNLTEWTVL